MPEETYLGHIDLNEKQLPEAKGWEVGKKYTLTVEVEMTGIRKTHDYSNMPMSAPGSKPQKPPKITKFDFDIKSVSTPKAKKSNVL